MPRRSTETSEMGAVPNQCPTKPRPTMGKEYRTITARKEDPAICHLNAKHTEITGSMTPRNSPGIPIISTYAPDTPREPVRGRRTPRGSDLKKARKHAKAFC